jgi:hypothetical protein
MVGIVIIRARHSAKIRAKSLIVLEKTIPIIAQLCSVMAVFGRKSVRFFQRSINTQQQSMMFIPTYGIELPPR